MQINITARHLDLTSALSDYVHRKVEKTQHYFDSIVWAQVVLSVEKLRHIAEIVVHTPGNTFRTKEVAGDLYSAIDLAAHKMDLRLSRIKDKQHHYHIKNNLKNINRMQESLPKSKSSTLSSSLEQSKRPFPKAVTETSRILLETFSLTEAVKELNSNGFSFLPFIDEKTEQICILYKKSKGTYGLLEVEE